MCGYAVSLDISFVVSNTVTVPELPEVEVIRRELHAAGLSDRMIVAARVAWPRTVGGDVAGHRRAIAGRRVRRLERRGKYIVIGLSGGDALIVHLRMSGRLLLANAARPPSGYERVVWSLDDGRELRLHDPRKFARAVLFPDPDALPEIALNHPLHGLGLEPLGDQCTPARLYQGLVSRRRQLKPLLLDQRALVAGVGNIYADEALWRAGLHPQRKSNLVSRSESDALHSAIRAALTQGIKNFGVNLGHGPSHFNPFSAAARNQEQLAVYGRAGQPCQRCGHPLERIRVSQRSTYFCSICQPS